MKSFLRLLSLFFLFACGSSDSASERDQSREQLRNYAQSKEAELVKVVGNYLGTLKSETRAIQDVNLTLAIKEDIIALSGQVDAGRMPRISGFLRLGYVANLGAASYISFAVVKGEYDDKLGLLNLDLENSNYGLFTLSLYREEGKLVGNWSSFTSSLAGEVEFRLLSDETQLTKEFSLTSFDTEMSGHLVRTAEQSYYFAKLVFQSQKRGTDDLALAATLFIYYGDFASGEYQTYKFPEVSFNALSGLLSMVSANKSITLEGSIKNGRFVGEWSSSFAGKIGKAEFHGQALPKPEQYTLEPTIQGDYEGTFSRDDSKTYHQATLKVWTTFNDRLRISADLRLAFADGSDVLQYRFNDVEVDLETGFFILVHPESEIYAKLQFQGGRLTGYWSAKSTGRIGAVLLNQLAEHVATPEGYVGAHGIAGSYKGKIVNTNPKTDLPKRARLNIVAIKDPQSPDGLRLSGSLRLYVGEFDSNEYNEYPLQAMRYNFFKMEFSALAQGIGIAIKGKVVNGRISGSLYHDGFGELGTIEVICE